MELKVKVFTGREYNCRVFFDANLGYGGIEITCLASGNLLGQMVSEELPDENDEDAVEEFTNKVEIWVIENE